MEQTATDIKTPVFYNSDNYRLTSGRDILGTFKPEVGQFIAKCINQHATLLTENAEQIVLFGERIKREVGMCCPDPWRSTLIARIDGEVQAYLAKESKQ